jgi:hypothetical protein
LIYYTGKEAVMEELQSTEILDREILEDARKKAHRILKNSDDTIRANAAEWEKKLAGTLDKLARKYAQQGKVITGEIMARLPIDKRRTKAKKIEALLNSAVESWYARLSRDQVLDLLKKELAKRLALSNAASSSASEDADEDGVVRVLIHNIEQAEAEKLMRAVLPGKSCTIAALQSVSAYPEMVVETADARIYASIRKTVDYFLGEKRAELVAALFGEST